MGEGSGQAPIGRALLRAGDLEIDPGLKRVTRDGADLTLPPLSFDLLVVLAESAPDYVSNDELMARVWPGLVVADKTITQRIKLLREALGDDSRQPRYIASLRGRGYRLMPPVLRNGVTPAVPGPIADRSAPHEPTRTAGTRFPPVRHVWPGAALVLVAAVVLAIAVSWERPAETPAGDTAAVAPEVRQSVAVLPFRDLSAAPGDAVLALGIPEIVLDQLARVPGLTVIARQSSFKAAYEQPDDQELGTRLGARFLIDGTVQRIGDELRVSAALTDTTTSTQLWVQRFDRTIDDVFAIQDEIALHVTDALRAHITRFDDAPLTRRPTDDTAAYLAYLEGRTRIARWTIADTMAAEQSFARAIAADSAFAAAHAALYDARLMLAERRQGGSANAPYRPRSWGPGRSLDRERTENAWLLDRALELDPDCGAAYFARATWADLPDAAREADFRKAIALDPGNARGITSFAEFLDSLDRSAEARVLLDRARAIDPLSPRPLYWLAMRDWKNTAARIEEDMRRVLELDPDYQPALQRYAKARWWGHAELAEATQLMERALASDPENPWLLHTAAAIYLDAGQIEAARELVHRTDRAEISGLLLLRLYEEDRDGAAQLAFADTAFAHGPFENWGVYEAVRDWSMHSGELARGIEYLRSRAELDLDDPEITALNFRSTPPLAELLLAAGRIEQADRLVTRSIRWIDDVHLARMGKTWALRAKANLELLQGNSDRALDTLRLAFEAPDYQQWWYTLERDPLWAPFRSDPRFVAIANTVHAHVSSQAERLQRMREDGFIPRRGIERQVTSR